MIRYHEALQLILTHAGERQTETLPLLAALSRISAAEIKSAMDVPSFRNSAMDGFAVRRADIASATPEKPVTLPVAHAIAAGDIHQASGASCVAIMTGALVSDAFDAVIPVEDVTVEKNMAVFSRQAKANENIRLPGEDVRIGQIVLRPGDAITSERIMLLAALGIAKIQVHKLPALHILSTGKEITDAADEPLPEGRIHNSNAPYLLARCHEEGIAAHYEGIIGDDAEAFETRIRAVPAGSVIVTTGAVSKGAWDFIPESLKKLGAKTHFHRVNIRPGKPILFAALPNNSWFFGLPGNPISAAVGFRFFVLPLVQALQGLVPEQPVMARLENAFAKKGNFRPFLKATLKTNADGELSVVIASGQESFKILPMAESNAWAVLEEDRLEYEAGSCIPVFPFAAAIPFPSHEEVSLCKSA